MYVRVYEEHSGTPDNSARSWAADGKHPSSAACHGGESPREAGRTRISRQIAHGVLQWCRRPAGADGDRLAAGDIGCRASAAALAAAVVGGGAEPSAATGGRPDAELSDVSRPGLYILRCKLQSLVEERGELFARVRNGTRCPVPCAELRSGDSNDPASPAESETQVFREQTDCVMVRVADRRCASALRTQRERAAGAVFLLLLRVRATDELSEQKTCSSGLAFALEREDEPLALPLAADSFDVARIWERLEAASARGGDSRRSPPRGDTLAPPPAPPAAPSALPAGAPPVPTAPPPPSSAEDQSRSGDAAAAAGTRPPPVAVSSIFTEVNLATAPRGAGNGTTAAAVVGRSVTGQEDPFGSGLSTRADEEPAHVRVRATGESVLLIFFYLCDEQYYRALMLLISLV